MLFQLLQSDSLSHRRTVMHSPCEEKLMDMLFVSKSCGGIPVNSRESFWKLVQKSDIGCDEVDTICLRACNQYRSHAPERQRAAVEFEPGGKWCSIGHCSIVSLDSAGITKQVIRERDCKCGGWLQYQGLLLATTRVQLISTEPSLSVATILKTFGPGHSPGYTPTHCHHRTRKSVGTCELNGNSTEKNKPRIVLQTSALRSRPWQSARRCEQRLTLVAEIIRTATTHALTREDVWRNDFLKNG
ncbi:hypothetical protein KCU93_g509, partial [Aureobasidium melanogenum]